MPEILHTEIPPDLTPSDALPGVRPLTDGQWLHRDEVYAAQTAYRRSLIAQRREDVVWASERAHDAINELFIEASKSFAALGISATARHIFCPDGTEIDREAETPLAVLGQVLQEDICILQKEKDEHVLTAAVLCFPASWTLAEKAGQPLTRIHRPVNAYSAGVARRVQRLFDGVQVGRPLWRNNYLPYDTADLYQPLSEADPERHVENPSNAPFIRAERQCILRLPQTRAVVFSIHTYVARRPMTQ